MPGQTHAMSPVWIGQVAGGVHLMRTNAIEQIGDDLHVVMPERPLAHAARFVERHIEKVNPLERHAAVSRRGPRLAAAG